MRLVIFALVLSGCASWTWRAPGKYSAVSAPVPTHASLAEADLPPEAYAIARAQVEDRDLDSLLPRLAEDAARAGAHAVVIDDLEAVTSTWNATYTPSDADQREVVRREEVQVSQSSARVEATALRFPTACIGLVGACDRPYANQQCQARVVEVRGPAAEAGLRPGNLVLAIDGVDVLHPWDLHRHVDRSAAGETFTLRVQDDVSARDLVVTSAPCAELHP